MTSGSERRRPKSSPGSVGEGPPWPVWNASLSGGVAQDAEKGDCGPESNRLPPSGIAQATRRACFSPPRGSCRVRLPEASRSVIACVSPSTLPQSCSSGPTMRTSRLMREFRRNTSGIPRKTHSRERQNVLSRTAIPPNEGGTTSHAGYADCEIYKKKDGHSCSTPSTALHPHLLPVSLQSPGRHNLDLALTVDRRLVAPLVDSRTPDAERVGQLLYAAEMGDCLGGVHCREGIACYQFGRQACCT